MAAGRRRTARNEDRDLIVGWQIDLAGITLHVQPKLGRRHLPQLLRYAYGLHELELLRPTRTPVERLGFHDLIAAQLLSEVEAIGRRGLTMRYTSQDEDLASPRGRIDIAAMARRGVVDRGAGPAASERGAPGLRRPLASGPGRVSRPPSAVRAVQGGGSAASGDGGGSRRATPWRSGPVLGRGELGCALQALSRCQDRARGPLGPTTAESLIPAPAGGGQ